MKNPVLLNNIDHKELKVKTDYSEAYGDAIASTPTFLSEYGDVHKEYPILFRKDPATIKFQSVVLLGFKKGENLFLTDSSEIWPNRWSANYVPGIVARGPFLIGFQDQSISGGEERVPVIHVDMNSPRVSFDHGEPLFLEFGGNTPYLEKISAILEGIHRGMDLNDAMFTAFEFFGLIEPLTIKIELNNGEKISIEDHYTISEEKLANLSGEALHQLNQSGFLRGAFLVLSSLSNINKLIEIKNSRL